MKFLGLSEEKEDSELIQIIKKAEFALLVSVRFVQRWVHIRSTVRLVSKFFFKRRKFWGKK